MMPPKMAIQTIHVRGGTRNSPPLFGCFSSSLNLLSSAMLQKFGRAKPNTAGTVPQPADLNPFPSPLQAARRLRRELKALGNSHPFQPKHFTERCLGEHQLMAFPTRNLLVHEEILQFHRRTHADWLNAIARSPMTQSDLWPNEISIECFPLFAPFWRFSVSGLETNDFPGQLEILELNLSFPALQSDAGFVSHKLRR